MRGVDLGAQTERGAVKNRWALYENSISLMEIRRHALQYGRFTELDRRNPGHV